MAMKNEVLRKSFLRIIRKLMGFITFLRAFWLWRLIESTFYFFVLFGSIILMPSLLVGMGIVEIKGADSHLTLGLAMLTMLISFLTALVPAATGEANLEEIPDLGRFVFRWNAFTVLPMMAIVLYRSVPLFQMNCENNIFPQPKNKDGSMNDSIFDVNSGYWPKFIKSAIATGMTEADLIRFCDKRGLNELLSVSRGLTKPIIPKIMIDTDVDPKLPYDGYSVLSHVRVGQLEWDLDRFHLYAPRVYDRPFNFIPYAECKKKLAELERNGELKGMVRVNVNAIPFFLKYKTSLTALVGNDKNLRLHFLGTVYKMEKNRYTPYLNTASWREDLYPESGTFGWDDRIVYYKKQ